MEGQLPRVRGLSGRLVCARAIVLPARVPPVPGTRPHHTVSASPGPILPNPLALTLGISSSKDVKGKAYTSPPTNAHLGLDKVPPTTHTDRGSNSAPCPPPPLPGSIESVHRDGGLVVQWKTSLIQMSLRPVALGTPTQSNRKDEPSGTSDI